MLIPETTGGLGNIMFQLASCYSISKDTGHTFGIHNIPFPSSNHSTVDYMSSILKPWVKFITTSSPTTHICDYKAHPISYDEFRKYDDTTIVQVKSTLQNYRYFNKYKDEILPLFDITAQQTKSTYSDIDNAFFIHVRRGDYVNNWFHSIDLTNYYTTALSKFNSGVVYVFSNDLQWCEDWHLLNDRRCIFVNENEVESLSLMAKCKRGGIAANSSFSWWGLYLDSSREQLYFPSRFFPHDILYQDGYSFPEVTIIPV
jgi:hypothetical protein